MKKLLTLALAAVLALSLVALRRQRQHQGRHIYRPVQGTVP